MPHALRCNTCNNCFEANLIKIGLIMVDIVLQQLSVYPIHVGLWHERD
jgi:hypothetical protein